MSYFYDADRRIETLSNVEEWNRVKADLSKDGKDRDRFLSNALNVAQERGELIQAIAVRSMSY